MAFDVPRPLLYRVKEHTIDPQYSVFVVQSLQSQFRLVQLRQAHQNTSKCTLLSSGSREQNGKTLHNPAPGSKYLLEIQAFPMVIKSDGNIGRENKCLDI